MFSHFGLRISWPGLGCGFGAAAAAHAEHHEPSRGDSGCSSWLRECGISAFYSGSSSKVVVLRKNKNSADVLVWLRFKNRVVASHEVDEGLCLDFRGRVNLEPLGFVPEVVWEVPIDVEPALAVFVVKLVAVIVDALRVNLVEFVRRGACFFLIHESRVFIVHDPVSSLIFDAHKGDHPVSVEVFRWVLVDLPVVIIIAWIEVAGIFVMDAVKKCFCAVRIESWGDIKSAFVQDSCDVLVFFVTVNKGFSDA